MPSAYPPPLTLEEAQAQLLALAPALPIEHVQTEQALGHYLAAPLIAQRNQPAADVSAMDGYAVGIDDYSGPWQVIGESAAGHPYSGVINNGQAIRISTGAIVPQGGAAIILQEDVQRSADQIILTGQAPAPPGRHIRRQGMDFHEGATLLETGAHIGPAELALALSAGHDQLPVRRIPHVVIIDSGDELSAVSQHCPPHQIPASNGAMLAATLAPFPCRVTRLGPVPDSMKALAAAFAQAELADLIVTSGGASVGDHDLIRPALVQWGADIAFWRVAIKPGKPLLVGTRAKQIVLGLPGNPVSGYVTAFLFLLPLLRAMLGAAQPLPRIFRPILSAPLPAGGSRREFVRAVWNGETIAPLSQQDSSALSALAASNAVIDRAAKGTAVPAGEQVTAYLLHNGGTF